VDRVSREARSMIMRLVRGKHGRTTERRVRAILVRYGISGWSMNVKSLDGRPDFVFWKSRLAVFINGCFWHGCNKCGGRPSKTRRKFWTDKIRRNRIRDRSVSTALRRTGWHVLTFWECELKNRPTRIQALKLLFSKIQFVPSSH
jgi:DNA mismatch endonuclease, patch repair protein